MNLADKGFEIGQPPLLPLLPTVFSQSQVYSVINESNPFKYQLGNAGALRFRAQDNEESSFPQQNPLLFLQRHIILNCLETFCATLSMLPLSTIPHAARCAWNLLFTK